MRLEIFILGITAFFVYNTYMDGKYTKMFGSFKKYYKKSHFTSMKLYKILSAIHLNYPS